MIAVDVTPLVLGPRRGVARALLALLKAWHDTPPPVPVHPIAPGPAPNDVPRLSGLIHPDPPVSSPRAMRHVIPKLLEQHDFRVFFSPWSAMPKCSIPTVVWIHELPFVRLGPIEGRWRTLKHRAWLRRNAEMCAGIVVPSKATRDDVIQAQPHTERLVRVVPNAFDPTPWRPKATDPPRNPYVLMIGTGERAGGARKKGLDVLFRAWKRLPAVGYELVVVGDSTLPLPPSARVVANPSDLILRGLMAGASALVYPSRSEGFGYPPLEAMAAGVPVLTTTAGSIPEVVAEAALCVPPDDDAALASALRRIVGDDDLRRRLTHAGHQRAKQFDPAMIGRRMIDVLMRAGSAR